MTFVAKLHWIMPLQCPRWEVICVRVFFFFFFSFLFIIYFFTRLIISDGGCPLKILSSVQSGLLVMWDFYSTESILLLLFSSEWFFHELKVAVAMFFILWKYILVICSGGTRWWTRYIKSVTVCNLNSEYFDIFQILCISTPLHVRKNVRLDIDTWLLA